MTPPDRSEQMRRIKSTGTAPERLVRAILTGQGRRYRLHRKDLPGTPDIAFIGRRKAIFVHGCFWHGHDCKRGARVPAANRDYWIAKVARNKARDAQNLRRLEAMGWRALCLFECELRDRAATALRLADFLDAD